MLKIIFEKDAAKHISKMNKPSKTRIKQAIDKLPAGDVKKLQGFVPADKPMPDEVEAIQRANKSIAEQGTVSYDEIDWN